MLSELPTRQLSVCRERFDQEVALSCYGCASEVIRHNGRDEPRRQIDRSQTCVNIEDEAASKESCKAQPKEPPSSNEKGSALCALSAER
jgi:hypothetical protein